MNLTIGTMRTRTVCKKAHGALFIWHPSAVEALGTEAQKNTELENAVRELTSTLKNQPRNIQNVEKVGVANVNITIETQNNTINFAQFCIQFRRLIVLQIDNLQLHHCTFAGA